MQRQHHRRVVVTGAGAITPLGLSVDRFWQSSLAGKSGISKTSVPEGDALPVRIAGEVHDFDARQYVEHKKARRMARFTQLAVAAAIEAVSNARLQLDDDTRKRTGVLLGNVAGGYEEHVSAVAAFRDAGPTNIDPFYVAKALPNLASATVAMVLDARGYNSTVTTACAAGTQAIGEALNAIRRGTADVMVAGGCESNLTPLGITAFHAMRALSTRNHDPTGASRPFDAERDGFVCAEGAAVLILEDMDHAIRRNAPIIAELAGYDANSDAYHVVASRPDGDGPMRAMLGALADAGLRPEDVDYINAHATSTQLNDAVETLAIKKAFGENAYRVPIGAVKSMVGHALGAAGALESIICLKAIETGLIPPTINYEHPDPACDLDYVPNEAREAEVKVVIKNSFGFGGQNACLVFSRFRG
jgi:3-oxoacyl-[acyl-carrier-protein] synthase II